MRIQGYSMENLKTSPGSKSQTDNHCNTTMSLPHSHTGKANDKVMPTRAWGSMQEIRKVTARCNEPDDCAVSVSIIASLLFNSLRLYRVWTHASFFLKPRCALPFFLKLNIQAAGVERLIGTKQSIELFKMQLRDNCQSSIRFFFLIN